MHPDVDQVDNEKSILFIVLTAVDGKIRKGFYTIVEDFYMD